MCSVGPQVSQHYRPYSPKGSTPILLCEAHSGSAATTPAYSRQQPAMLKGRARMTETGALKRRRTRRATVAAGAPRERNRPLRVVVSASERAQIEALAQSAGMSVSAYLRSFCLGHRPASVFDTEAVRALAKVAGDQGRLGGLLKLWLSERPGEGGSEIDIVALLQDLQMVTAAVHKTLDRL